MELEIIFARENNSNISYGRDFFENNKAVAIPYMILTTLTGITGTVGNSLVLGSLIINKVS